MSARLERIARMRPDDRLEAVTSWIEGLIHGSLAERDRIAVKVTFRNGRHSEPRTEQLVVVGVARNDNGTSFGELIVQAHSHSAQRLFGISLANVDALEFGL